MKDLLNKVEMIEKKMDIYVEFYGWSSNETKALKDQLDQLNSAIIELMLLDQEIIRIKSLVA
jgi:hypothetical protein